MALATSSLVTSREAANAAWRAATTACSSSAPVRRSAAPASSSSRKCSGRRWCLRRWMARISARSRWLGRSTKKSSSKRPRRRSSGGSRLTSLAVATTKTGERFSASQVRKEPKTRLERASASAAAKPFSISSIQSTAGAIDSATWPASRIAASGLVCALAKAEARSRRRSGNCHSLATALAQSDLPQPWTPSSRSPRGAGSPKRRASSPKARRRSVSQRLSSPSPPTSPRPASASWKARAGVRRSARRLSRTISATASASRLPERPPQALRKTRTASPELSPSAPRTAASRSSGDGPAFSASLAKSPRRSAAPGSGSSRRAASRSSSSGSSSTGPTSTTAWRRAPSSGRRSRRRRTPHGSPSARWASSRAKSAGSRCAAIAARPASRLPAPWPPSPRPEARVQRTQAAPPEAAARSSSESALSSSKVSRAIRRQPERTSARSSSAQAALTAALPCAAPSLAVRRHAQHLREGRRALREPAHRRLAQALHALDPRRVPDLVGVAALRDQAADAPADVEHLEDGRAAEEARLAALGAALAPAHLQAVAALDRDLEAERGDLLGIQRPLHGAALADAADQALRDHAAQHAGQQEAVDAELDQARDRPGRVPGVDGREDQVAGQGGLHGHLRRLRVADLADHDHVRVLAQDRAQRVREGKLDRRLHLHLAEARVDEIDRVHARGVVRLGVRKITESW